MESLLLIDLIALQTALLVLEHGSFRRAAIAIGVRPSVVSRRVRSLEDVVGVSLFQRQSQGAEPTLAGRRFLARGRGILDDIGDLERTAGRDGAGAEGMLRLGIVSSVASGTARDLLKMFLSAHPRVDLEIAEGSPRDHLAAVRALKLDLALLTWTRSPSDCVIETLWSEPTFVALPADHRLAAFDTLAFDQLAEERFLVSRGDPGPEIHDFIVKHLSDLGRHPVVEFRSVHREGLMASIGLGLGVTLCSASAAGVGYPGVAFRRLAGKRLPFSLVWSAKNDNPALRRFLSLARIQAKKLAQEEPDSQDQGSSATAAEPPRSPDPSP